MNASFAWAAARQEKRTGSSAPTPELRLPFLQAGMVIVPVGLVLFAWSAGRTHWIVPLLGAFIFGMGLLMGYVCIHSYLVDCFGKWAASALAAAVVTRCTITAAFTIVGFELYRKLGYDWFAVPSLSALLNQVPNCGQGIDVASIFLHRYGAYTVCSRALRSSPARETNHGLATSHSLFSLFLPWVGCRVLDKAAWQHVTKGIALTENASIYTYRPNNVFLDEQCSTHDRRKARLSHN